MIGIEVEYEFKYGNILQKMFENTDYQNYKWYIAQQEILIKNDNLFLPELISEKELLSFMKSKEEYLIIEINIQIYKKESSMSFIRNYKDFVKSNCEMIVLISDCNYLEIYFKNNKLKEMVLNNLEILGIKYDKKFAESDGRTIMKI